MRRSNETDRATAYAHAVLNGRIIAGKPVRLACERHLNDLRDGHKRGLKYEPVAAAKIITFFEEFLILPETEGERFILQPWQAFIIGSLFGWKKDGYRRFRTAYIEIGKGNGKSPLAAGVGLVGLVADREHGAQIFSAAVNREQAKILWSDADKMVASSPELRAIIKRNVNNLSVASTGSYFRPVSAEKRGLDGKRVHMGLIDELHEHPSGVVVNKMSAGTKGRKQALIFEITNSGFDRESVCWQHHDYSIRILEGNAENDSWFGYVCQLDLPVTSGAEGDDWTDPKVWIKANPNLGVSIPDKYLAEQVKKALDVPAEENIVKRLNMCVWTEQATRAIPMEQWDACSAKVEVEDGEPCYAGLDMANTMDKCAFVLVFPERNGKPWRVKPHYWVPRAKVEEREKRGDTTYQQWEKNGFLKVTEGNVIDYNVVKQDIIVISEQFKIIEVPKDPWNSTNIGTNLTDEGLNIIDFPQTMSHYAAPTKEFLGAVASMKIAHGGHPVLRADVSAFATYGDANGNMKPDRKKSGGSIDGVAGTLMGMGRAMSTPLPKKSKYESDGLMTI